MASLAGLAEIGHGGTAGAIVEALVAVAVVGAFIAVWLRERSARKSHASRQIRGEDDRE
jgi:hypothetical protein